MYSIFLLLFLGNACITASEPQTMSPEELVRFMVQLDLQNQKEAEEQKKLQAQEEEENPVCFVAGEVSAAPVVAAGQVSQKPQQPKDRKRKEQADKTETQEDPNKKKPQKPKDRKRKDGEE